MIDESESVCRDWCQVAVIHCSHSHGERTAVLAKALSCAVVGLDSALVEVEVDLSPGLPSFQKVGWLCPSLFLAIAGTLPTTVCRYR